MIISVSMSEELLEQLDDKRKDVSRSKYLRRLIEDDVSDK